MKKLVLAWLLVCLLPSVCLARNRFFGWCEKGGASVITQGLQSTTKVQQSFPSCTIDVFYPGLLTHPPIYSDMAGTPKTNPFTANTDGSWYFYADVNVDVKRSGAGIPAPGFTWGDWPLSSGSNHALLSTTHPDTTPAAVTRAAIITGQGASPTWASLAKGTASQCLKMDGTASDVVWGTCGGSGSTVWNSLTSATGHLNLSTGVYSSTFNSDGATDWVWADVTAATALTNWSSPRFNLQGTYWTGSASAPDYWQLSNWVGDGTNPTSTFRFYHTGSSGTSSVRVPALILDSSTQYGALYGGGASPIGSTAAGTTGQCLIAVTSGAPIWGSCAGSTAWSSLTNPTTSLNLSMGEYGTFFNYTVPYVLATWANTTAATSGIAQSSPGLGLGGKYWTGSSSGSDWWYIQNVVGSGTNGTSTLTFTHNGSSGVSAIKSPHLIDTSSTNYGVLYGGGTSPIGSTAAGTTGDCLVATTGAAPVWGSCAGSGSNHNLLSTTHPDTTPAAVTRAAIITGQGASPTWASLAKGTANQCLKIDGTGTDVVWGTCATGGSIAWSSLTNPIGHLVLSMNVYTTTFNHTNYTPWTWANITAATSGANQQAPYFHLLGNYWNGSASISDYWNIGQSLGSGSNPTSTFIFTHSGTSGTAAINVPHLIDTSTTQYGALYGGGASLPIGSTNAGTTGQCLLATTGAAPSWGSCLTGGGISSLNGLTAAAQTFANGTAGTSPSFASLTSTHTLNIPMAATGGVTAGLLSKTQYDIFNGKQNALSFPLISTQGGTGNSFTNFSGPNTTEKTFILPNVSATILTTNALVSLAQGGTNANITGLASRCVHTNAAGTAFELMSGDCGTSTITNPIVLDGTRMVYRPTFAGTAVFGDGGQALGVGSAYNTFVGLSAGESLSTATYNTFVGYAAGKLSVDAFYNTVVGTRAFENNTDGDFNTAVGGDALFSNTTGDDNTSMGMDSMYYNTTGSNNTAYGFDSLAYNTTGNANVAIGSGAMHYTNGSQNVAVGRATLGAPLNSTGINNVAIGEGALGGGGDADENVAVGMSALSSITTGIRNTAVGTQSGISLQTASHNTFLGYLATSTVDGVSNSTAIGDSAEVSASNQVVIGNPSVTQTILRGVVTVSKLATTTNCVSAGSPAGCSSAPSGSVVIAAAATSVVVNTTAVTADSQIHLTVDSSLGTRLGVTCNSQSLLVLGTPKITGRSASTSFTANVEVAPTTDPLCLSYTIVN